MKLIMISGGVRSGKSKFAEELATRCAAGSPVLYVATGRSYDAEMQQRIEAHQGRRPSHWGCIEAADSLVGSVRHYNAYSTVLVDTMSARIGNVLMSAPETKLRSQAITAAIQQEMQQWIVQLQTVTAAKEAKTETVIVVTDEAGLGGVAMTPLGRWFQDVVGDANQAVAAAADEVYFVVSGLPWRVKG
ncbi:bifunctional adenosylcobinamide kinase/adenosylcobinamide-phosphate guanylyltransferase [Paenibacillus gansuensis]|uniref:Adenosylcobinamide kinase n=1 Tax=Paenibacillus gansuensis TaxID=306542 RepID=A0ABW5P751_9BACL